MEEQPREVPPYIVNPEAPAYFVNSVRILSSIFDFTVLFFQLKMISTEEGDQGQLREVAKIYLSPQHAKAISELLSRKVSEYEEQFGPIPTGPIDHEEPEP